MNGAAFFHIVIEVSIFGDGYIVMKVLYEKLFFGNIKYSTLSENHEII